MAIDWRPRKQPRLSQCPCCGRKDYKIRQEARSVCGPLKNRSYDARSHPDCAPFWYVYCNCMCGAEWYIDVRKTDEYWAEKDAKDERKRLMDAAKKEGELYHAL